MHVYEPSAESVTFCAPKLHCSIIFLFAGDVKNSAAFGILPTEPKHPKLGAHVGAVEKLFAKVSPLHVDCAADEPLIAPAAEEKLSHAVH